MMHEWILAIDQGTTNTKALLIDRNGQTAFRASAPVALLQPQPGYVEQDAHALWLSVCSVTDECVQFASTRNAQIVAIAISNQRETALAWDRDGRPVSGAISWQCRRSAPTCERLHAGASVIQTTAGLPLDPLLTATKWAWLFDQQPNLRSMAQSGQLHLGTVDSWLIYKMSGGQAHVTDHTNASRTALMSLDSLSWNHNLLTLFEIPQSALPAIRTSSGICAECTAIPSLAGVPIASLIGDSHAALVGHGCYESGTVKATYGTGSSLMMLTPSLVSNAKNLARTVAWSAPEGAQFALEGNIAMSGAAVQWVGEFLGLTHPAEDAAALAATVSDADGLMLVPAMVGLGAPHWDSLARGLVAGIERSHKAAHLARAALDAIAFQVADVLEAMEATAGITLPLLLADGGATRNRALMQMQADIIGRPVHSAIQEDLSARGAALLAGLALGWWKSSADLAALPTDAKIFTPDMSANQREQLRAAWRLAVHRARLSADRKEGKPC